MNAMRLIFGYYYYLISTFKNVMRMPEHVYGILFENLYEDV